MTSVTSPRNDVNKTATHNALWCETGVTHCAPIFLSIQVFTASAEYLEFGSSHNIISNEDTGYVYAVGLRAWEWDLQTRVKGDRIMDKWKKSCDGKAGQ